MAARFSNGAKSTRAVVKAGTGSQKGVAASGSGGSQGKVGHDEQETGYKALFAG